MAINLLKIRNSISDRTCIERKNNSTDDPQNFVSPFSFTSMTEQQSGLAMAQAISRRSLIAEALV